MNPVLQLIEPAIALYNLAHDGILITDDGGKIVYSNDSASRLFGYKQNELLHSSCSKLNHQDVSFSELLEDLVLHKTLIKKITCKKSDGESILITSSFALLIDVEQKPIGVIIIFKQNHLESEEEVNLLEKQSDLLRALNYRTDEIYTLSDVLTRQYLLISLSCERIVGWSQQEFLQGGWAFFLTLVHPEDYRLVVDNFLQELNIRNSEKYKHDHQPITYEYRIRHRDGSWKWLYAEGIVLERDQDGLVRYLITFSRDITHEKVIKDELSGSMVEELLNGDLSSILSLNQETDISPRVAQTRLSPREKEILLLVKDGNSTKQISDLLQLTEYTINTYRKSLMHKLNARNSAELVRICMEQKII